MLNGRPTRARWMKRADALCAGDTPVPIFATFIIAGEMLASILLTHHNLAFFLDTMRGVRQSIRSGDFMKFRREFTERFNISGQETG